MVHPPCPPDSEVSHKIEEVLTNVQDLLSQSEALERWCSPGTVRRYLAARSWDVHKASKMLQATLEWRLEHGPEKLRWPEVSVVCKTGRVEQLLDVDHAGRLIVIMRLRHPMADVTPDLQLKFLMHMMERSCRHADALGNGKLTWVLDMEGYSRKTSPPFSVSMATIRILQNHYPERLGHAIVVRPTTFFSWLWRAITPIMDPVTKEKVTFLACHTEADLVAALEKHMPRHLAIGALTPDAFDHDAYSQVVLREEAVLWP
eukprot:jgi/Botrbrau1/5526/Bobra.0023s0013.1